MSVCVLVLTFLVCLTAEAGSEKSVLFPRDEVVWNCKTKDGQNGICKEIETCPSALKSIRKETPTICYFEKKQPVVCCAEDSIISEHLTEDDSSDKDESGFDSFVDACGSRPTFFRGLRQKKRTTAVVGGIESVPYSWPWMVAIVKVSPIGTSRFLCGGTLISSRHVITAAHCFQENLRASRYKILVGLHMKTEGTLFDVEKVTLHEEFISRQGYHDIAIVQLTDDVLNSKDVGAVCLPESSTEDLSGKVATITGWGDIAFGGKSSSVLREVQIPIIDNKACNNSYYQPDSRHFDAGIIESQLCAGLPEGGKDACQGDSGGPLVLETESNRWSIVGIVSFGIGCAVPGYPGVYTRVSSHLPWIKEQSGISPVSPTGAFRRLKTKRASSQRPSDPNTF